MASPKLAILLGDIG